MPSSFSEPRWMVTRSSIDVVIADLDARGGTPVRQVLRLAADGDERLDRVEFADPDRAQQTDMPDQPRAPTDLDIGTDHAARPDKCILGHVRTGIDAR